MSLRVAIGGIAHETNTYATACFGPSELDRFHRWRGATIVERNRGVHTCIGGIIDGADENGVSLLPTYFATAEPAGTISSRAYASMKQVLLADLERVGPVDAVLLDLHGAAVAEHVDDLEADLGTAVRAVVGPRVPIAATLDLHANVTDSMTAVFDLLVGYHLYPHTDMRERGLEAIELLVRMLRDELHPMGHVEHLPMLLPTSTTDVGHPAHVMNQLCAELERAHDLVDCTVFHGFPYTDVPHVGVHVHASAHRDRPLAARSASRVARWIWEHREQFQPEVHTPEAAVRRAAAAREGPVVLNETSDNPGTGAPGDGTRLLRAMIDAGLANACFGFVVDPAAVDTATSAGVGSTVELRLGGRHDPNRSGGPLTVRAHVKAITDGRFTLRAMAAGARVNIGPMARLEIGGPDGIDVLVSSRRAQTFDPEVFLLNGIDVERYDVVALKSSHHFRAGFGHIAREIITVDSPGLSTVRLEHFERRAAPGPLWPIDPTATYPL